MKVRFLLPVALVCGLASLLLRDSSLRPAAPLTPGPVVKAGPVSPSRESHAAWSESAGAISDPTLEKVFTAARLGIRAITSTESLNPENEGALFFATSPAQQLAARFRVDGAAIRNSSGGEPLAIALRDAGSARISTKGSRIEYQRADGSTEWYQNSGAGFEHGMTLAARPDENAAELRIRFQSGGLTAGQDAENPGDLLFRDKHGAALYGYRDLKAWDATGRDLQGELAVADGGFDWVIADRDAVYPVTIDPLVVNLQQVIAGSAADTDGSFGGSQVDIDGDRAMIAAGSETTPSGTFAGVVYLFHRSAGNWVLEKQIESLDPREYEFFGSHAALDGETLAVVAKNDIEPVPGGSVQMFRYTGFTWLFDTKLQSNGNVAYVSSISLKGSTLVLGLPGRRNLESVSTGAFMVSTRPPFGQWSFFHLVFPPDGQEGEAFGYSVDIDGSFIAVGAPGRSQGTKNYCGSVYVYQAADNFWTKQAQLFATDGTAGDQLGTAVAMDDGRIVAGAPEQKRGAVLVDGAAYIFAPDGSSWAQESKIFGPLASGFHIYLGNSVAIANGGSRVAVSSKIGKVHGGHVLIYERVAKTWFRRTSLVTDNANDYRYSKLAMNDSQLIVGFPSHGPLGAVYVHDLGNSNTSQDIAVFTGRDNDLHETQSGATVAYGEVYPNEPKSWPVTILNDGATQLEILDASLLEEASPGLTVDPLGGLPGSSLFIEPGQAAQVTLRTNFSTLGPKGGTLRLTSNDPDEAFFNVPVTFEAVVKPVPPGLTLSRENGITVLRYPHLQFSSYLIRRSTDLISWQQVGSMHVEFDPGKSANVRIFRDFIPPQDKVFYRLDVE